ncbi:MAG: DUF1566 domain-containing protein [Proteobacteria bacterium]|nr:DUF1566 domain-containing protein [Pseudomonadota bacterium]
MLNWKKNFFHSFLVGLFICFNVSITFGDTSVSGIITNDTTWTEANNPYIIVGNIGVEKGVTLTIEPGVQVIVDGYYYLGLKGKIVANGTDSKPIVFTSSPSFYDWEGIEFILAPDSDYSGWEGSIFNYVKISHARAGISTASDMAILINPPTITIRNSTFNDIGSYGVHLLFYCTIENNYFTGISLNSSTPAIYSGGSIQQNIIENSSSGGILGEPNTDSIISENIINHCEGVAINARGVISNNLVINNDIGISTEVARDASEIKYNTIYNNRVGMEIVYDSRPIISNNNIFSDSEYGLLNTSANDVTVTNNWWGTINQAEIDHLIYDYYDEFTLGKISYYPYLLAIDPIAPIPPPTNLQIGYINGEINLSWDVVNVSDLKGYKIYYGTTSSYPYNGSGADQGDSPIDVGNTTHFTISSLPPGTCYFAITAYDNSADHIVDQIEGHESWYSNEVSVQLCTYSISPTSKSFDANGGASSVIVSTPTGCAWTATSNASWISITSGSNGTGNGVVNYSVSANTNTSSRTGTMTVAEQTFTVTQSAGSADTVNLNLPRTGQTNCYDTNGNQIPCAGTGQDGEIQAGVAWPSPRFTVSGDCVTDNLTGLMWAKNGNPLTGYKTWNAAVYYCNNLTLCGYDDWRLPNVNELESLVNGAESNPATWLNTQGFTNVQANYYWSSTTNAYSTVSAWSVTMDDGYVGEYGKSSLYYVWPVRSGQDSSYPAPVWKTGQTTSYETGDDGDLEKGVAWPVPRFTNPDGKTPVNGNVVVDQLTGLMWTMNANLFGVDKTWQQALDYVKEMNNGNYENLGYTDWRLPNRKELHSLTDYSRYNPALPSGHPFTNVQANYYWSSTTYASYTDVAWYVLMLYGRVEIYGKSSSSYVWPVRSGQAGPLGDLDISVIKTDAPDPVTVGSNLTYTITVTNNGPETATGVILTDTLPSNVTYVSATSTQGTCSKSGDTVTCNVGTMSNGASATVTMEMEGRFPYFHLLKDTVGWRPCRV